MSRTQGGRSVSLRRIRSGATLDRRPRRRRKSAGRRRHRKGRNVFAHGPEPEHVTVVTVDDQAVFRRAARDVVLATPGFEAIGEAESGPEALQLVERTAPALVLLDVRMPGMDGIETARLLASAAERAVVVLVTIDDLSALPAPASCGAAAVIRKQDFSPRTLRELWAAHGRSLPAARPS